MADMVTLTCSWGRAPLPNPGTPQINYLLVEAQPAAPPPRTMPLNFCLVLDRSGSMQGAKLNNMKKATKRVIEQLTSQDVVSLVVFDDTVQVVVPATPAMDKEVLLDRIDTIEENGGTAMSLGLQAGQDELRTHAGPGYLSHMLLLTDGQTWGDEDTCRNIAESLGKDQVQITALGLGDEWNEDLLDHIADLTNGSSDYIADPNTIDQFFQRTVQAVQGTAARDVRLLLRLIGDVTPRAVHRITPGIANLGYQPIGQNEVSVRMSDLAYENQSSVLLDLMIPPRAVGTFRIAQAELHFVPVGSQAEEMIKQDVLLDVVAEARQAVYNPRVMNLVEKVTAFKLQTRALEEAEAGNMSGATQKLRAAATRLLDLGELELAEKAQTQANQLEQGADLSSEDQKTLRYATRRLTQRLD
jgi:Ca-activated chloride channel homolog